MKKTLNVGCGDRTFDEYPKDHKCINYDQRFNLKKVDVVGDVRILPFPDEYFNYILASDIIEHFPIKETDNILSEWRRVLKPQGIIEFRLPNLRKICQDYIKGKSTAKNTSWLLYGGQTYPGNFHYVGFDREWFKEILKKAGFNEISYKEKGNNFLVKYKKTLD